MTIFKKFRLFAAIALLATSGMTAVAQQLAFPDAAGWGRFATGGRTGSVYHVTNLNDSGTGSLRDAVSQPNRIVVFDVAGVIKLNSIIVFKNNLYVAGQTAPGEGITVYGGRVSFSGASNTIVRYMRFRLGHAAGQVDCAGAANGHDMIFDHCSFGWGGDETFSLNPDGKNGGLYNITLSNSIMGQGLMPHSAGGLVQTENVTLYRNLYCDNATRNNKIKGINQYANNIVYNWKDAAYNMGGDSEGQSYCNIESNLFINGPAKGGAAFTGGNSNFHFYADDNWQDNNMDGKYDPFLVTSYSGADRQSKPYDYPVLDLYAGNELLEKNLPTVGASLPYRDYVDYYMMDEIMSYGKKGALVSDENTLPYPIPTLWNVWKGDTRLDSDKDGMPDAWEEANGTDKTKNDAMIIASNGYANIENYINSITIDDRQYFLRTPMLTEQTSATTTTMTITWRDWTYGEEGFIVEIQEKNGAWKEVARTEAGKTSVIVSGLNAGTQYQVRLCAYAGETKSAYTEEMKMSTRPEVVGMIDPDTYQAEHTLSVTGTANWGDESLVWNNNTTAYSDGNETLIAPAENTTLNITNAILPTNVVVKGDADVTFQGDGYIAGAASLNKAGKGTLSVNTNNDYKGATVLHDGVLEFNSIANGGSKSAIGSSVEFAQNWIWNGGTYRYTGGNATTNRSFQLLRDTRFEITSGSTITFSGASMEGAAGANSTATLILDGNGTFNVDDKLISKHSGAIQIDGGTLFTPTEPITKAYGANLKKLIMNGGTLKTTGTTSGYETYSFPIEVKEGSVSTLDLCRNNYMNNTLSGSGTLVVNVPYLREYVNFKYSNFTGRIIANGKSSEKGGSLYLIQKGASNMTQGVLELAGNARLCGWDTSQSWEVGGISGGPNTCISGSSKNTASGWTATWTVGSANTDETFQGTTNNYHCSNAGNGTVVIKKVGTGLWRLTNNNLDHKGATTVSGGTLVMNGTLKNSAITVASGATLKGMGTISQAATLNSNSTLEAGDTLVNGKGLTFSSTLKLAGNNTVSVPVTLEKCNTITVNGAMTIGAGSPLSIIASEEGLARAPYANTEYQIFKIGTNGSITGTFSSITTEVLAEGQSWDDSELYTKGVLRVVGGDVKPSDDDPTPGPGDDDDPAGETMRVTLAYGNMTPKSYDDSGVNNMLIGAENKESNGVLNNNIGFSLVCTGNLAKELAKGTKMKYDFDGVDRTNIKISNGAQCTVFLPENARATKLELWSTVGTNASSRTSYWKEVCGVTYTEADAKILDLTAGAVNCATFTLPNVDKITFTNTGEQQCVIINIDYHYGGPANTTGIDGVIEVSSDSNTIYDLSGRRITNAAAKGVYIKNGKTWVR